MNELPIVLPMAFVMVTGPQIVTAILLATGVHPRRNSAFFLLGAAAATAIGVTAAYWLTGLLGKHASPLTGDDRIERAVDLAIVVLLLLLAWKVFRQRHDTEPPRWMAKLETATPLFALKMGVLLFLLLPGDLLSMATVGAYLAHHDSPWWHSLLFVGLTVLLAGIPLLLLLVLGRRAKERLPKARDWMTANSWVVSEIVIAFFLLMTLKSLLAG
jgi:threonine/homoserine/homoserine lactone efflux protein